MNIYIDRVTGKSVSSPSALTYEVTVDDVFTLSKVIEVQDGEKQKTNELGQLLYKININEDGAYEETIESRTPIKFEHKEVINKWSDENGAEHSESVEVEDPIEWEDNKPIMIPNMVSKTVTFAEFQTEFTVEEILKAKYQSLLDSTSYEYILADIFLNEEDIDLLDKDHAANTGVAIMQLLQNGQAKTNVITLQSKASSFSLLGLEASGVELYINDAKIIDNKATLAEVTDTITIKFVNKTENPVNIKSYAIAY